MNKQYSHGTDFTLEDVQSRLVANTPATQTYSVPADNTSPLLLGDKALGPNHTPHMSTTISQLELESRLLELESRMDRRAERMERETDRRSDEFRREMELRDAAFQREQTLRDQALSERFSGFLTTQLERDKRYELISERVTKAAEGAEAAAKQAVTVKANYWAAVAVQLLAVAAILVGAYYANQGNVFMAMQTTIAAFQTGQSSGDEPATPSGPLTAPPPAAPAK